MSLLLNKAKARGTSESISIKDNFGKLVIVCLGTSLLGLAFNVGILIGIFQIASKPAPALVQLEDGSSIAVEAVGSLERTDKAIQAFINNIFSTTFTWTGAIPAGDKPGTFVVDKGIAIADAKGQTLGSVTTPAWEATYAFDLNFREEFLRQLAQLIPQSVFTHRSDVAFIAIEIGQPEKVSQGRWKVRLISNLFYTTGISKAEKIIPYNVDVYIRAVVPPIEPDGRLLDTRSKTLAAQVDKYRRSAMQIENIVSYQPENLR